MFILTSIETYKDFNNFEQTERNTLGVFDDLEKTKKHAEELLDSFMTQWNCNDVTWTLSESDDVPLFEIKPIDYNNFN